MEINTNLTLSDIAQSCWQSYGISINTPFNATQERKEIVSFTEKTCVKLFQAFASDQNKPLWPSPWVILGIACPPLAIGTAIIAYKFLHPTPQRAIPIEREAI